MYNLNNNILRASRWAVLATVTVLVSAIVTTPVNAAIVTVFGDDVGFTYDDATLFGAGTVVGKETKSSVAISMKYSNIGNQLRSFLLTQFGVRPSAFGHQEC